MNSGISVLPRFFLHEAPNEDLGVVTLGVSFNGHAGHGSLTVTGEHWVRT